MIEFITAIAVLIGTWGYVFLTVIGKIAPVVLFVLFFTPFGHFLIIATVIGYACSKIED